MSHSHSHRKEVRLALGDFCLAFLSIAGAAVLFVGASTLPPPRFEPLGSAAMPRILGAIMIFLAVIVAIQAALVLRRIHSRPAVGDQGVEVTEEKTGPKANLGLVVLCALVLYVAALDFAQLPFVPTTTAFVMLVGMVLSRFNMRMALLHALLGFVLAASVSYIFSTFLFIEIG